MSETLAAKKKNDVIILIHFEIKWQTMEDRGEKWEWEREQGVERKLGTQISNRSSNTIRPVWVTMFLIIVFVLYHTERVLCYAFAFARLEQMTIDT